MSHYIRKCAVCGVVISQCSCMTLDKTVSWGICDKCIQQEQEEEIPDERKERTRETD